MKGGIRCALTLAVALVAGATMGGRPRAATSLLLVTLDTTRADRLPMYGYTSVDAPALSRLAATGVVFDQAVAVAPLTLPTHTSLLTGLYPPHHGVRDNADAPLPVAVPTLATILRARGLRTAAFVGSAVLAADRGLARGFDVYDDAVDPGNRRRPGNDVVDRALAWLRQDGRAPFFLWVHLYDAHAVQRLPADYRRRYGDTYDGGVAFAAAEAGRLLGAIEADGLGPSTAVIVAGDHGESLGDHGEDEHGVFVYDAVLRVPLIVRAPGLPPGRVHEPVSQVDVLPTALSLLGVPFAAGDGVSLAQGQGRARPRLDRPVYAESLYPRRFGWSALRVLRDDRFKYIDAPRPELYDLLEDPLETVDVSAERAGTASAMRRALGTAVVEWPPVQSANATRERDDPELRARLGALGYVGFGPAPATASGIDPKDVIRSYNESRRNLAR